MMPPRGTVIDSTDIPRGEGTTGNMPEYVYPDKYYGAELSQRVFSWLRNNLPKSRVDGKPFQGVSVCIYRPSDRDWHQPWMLFAFDGELNSVDATRFTGGNAEQLLYVLNAMRKAKFTLRTGLPSSAALETHRHLREPGDFCYDGCVIIDDVLGQGIVVSISGYTKEIDAEAATDAGTYLTSEMQAVIDELDSVSHYWAEGPTKELLLEMISSGVPLNKFGETLQHALDGSDGIPPNGFKPLEV